MDDIPSPLASLTEREYEILQLLAEGLTDREISETLYLTVGTVKWYNRQIYSKLAVSNRTEAVNQAQRLGLLNQYPEADEIPSPLRLPYPQHNLPAAVTSFVGRQHELVQLKDLVKQSRLVTLTGPPGVGKTRLALELADQIHQDYPDGAFHIPLAALEEPVLTSQSITRVLDVKVDAADMMLVELRKRLWDKRLLLILDNFEHLLSAASFISDLLACSPALTVVVTSREPLRLYGEQEFPVPPLQIPVLKSSLEASEITTSDAVELFIQRAKAMYPAFELDNENASAIAAICVHVDGLPLAIELAAARIKHFAPQTLLVRLSSRLDMLTGGPRDLPSRQRALRSTIAWSYDLLENNEKLLFARLGAFRGGRTLEAIETVCADGLDGDLFDVLAGLVDKSLVYREDSPLGEPRFYMLQTIREYAHELLEKSGELHTIYQQHAEYLIQFAEHAGTGLLLANHGHWAQRFEEEKDNFRAVLQWSLNDGDLYSGIRLAGALREYWNSVGYHKEGLRWTRQFLPHLETCPPELHATFLNCAAVMEHYHDEDYAHQLFLRALDVVSLTNDPIQEAWTLTYIGYILRGSEDAIPTTEAGLAIFEAEGDQHGAAKALNVIGEIARHIGDDAYAEQAYERCLELLARIGGILRTSYIYVNLAFIAQHRDDHAHAITLLKKAASLHCQLNNQMCLVRDLPIVAISVAVEGNLHRAARLIGAGYQMMERMGAYYSLVDRQEIDQAVEAIRAALGDTAFNEAYCEGQKLDLHQAYKEAYGDDHGLPLPRQDGRSHTKIPTV